MGKRPAAEVKLDRVKRRIDKELKAPVPPSKKSAVKDSTRRK